jgi:hypothetical protein
MTTWSVAAAVAAGLSDGASGDIGSVLDSGPGMVIGGDGIASDGERGGSGMVDADSTVATPTISLASIPFR